MGTNLLTFLGKIKSFPSNGLFVTFFWEGGGQNSDPNQIKNLEKIRPHSDNMMIKLRINITIESIQDQKKENSDSLDRLGR